MKRESLLATCGAIAIAAAAVGMGYSVERRHEQQTAAVVSPAPVVAVAAMPAKPAAKVAAKNPGGTGKATAPKSTTSKAAPAPVPLKVAVADKALVAVSGTVTAKKGNALTLAEASGPVRVIVREDAPKPWDITTVNTTMDNIPVGTPVTIYGRVRTNTPDMPKVYADAVYDSATHTLYVNDDKAPADLTPQAITAPYMPVRGAHAPAAVSKVTTGKSATHKAATKVTTYQSDL